MEDGREIFDDDLEDDALDTSGKGTYVLFLKDVILRFEELPKIWSELVF